ncbi:hypothetical protein NECAME_02663 [Necator americanus]|uniref:Uncharacterized protein n=1 Tax=Necator americanus TaxID=51031 RepID=W2TDY8_NECAM|nr:hypothetical protein NECAME_02663 [Necator americanus]ETN79237.1 hypothetical protein NECAME_02663 [Necator americanus]
MYKFHLMVNVYSLSMHFLQMLGSILVLYEILPVKVERTFMSLSSNHRNSLKNNSTRMSE